MNREQEHAEFDVFIDGLRAHMKQCGRFLGKPIAPDWHQLDEKRQDDLINAIFVRHVIGITRLAHDAIHGLI